MRVYLATYETISKTNKKDVSNIFLLSSYFKHVNKQGVPYYINPKTHLLDSRAFSFLNNKKKGVQIDWDKYIEGYASFIKKSKVQYFFELDIDPIVGLPKVEALRSKLENLTKLPSIPVWHKSRGLDYWIKMCEEYDYVAIGGIVTREIKPSQYPVFSKLLKIAKEKDCKVNGLGFTNMKGLRKYKFYSVDSTNWNSARFGSKGLCFFNVDTIKWHPKPKGYIKKDLNKLKIHKFYEWVKFQEYANRKL